MSFFFWWHRRRGLASPLDPALLDVEILQPGLLARSRQPATLARALQPELLAWPRRVP